MKKSIEGLTYLTGTSEGAIYPVTMWDDETGMVVGIRLEILASSDDAAQIALYARFEQYVKGSDEPQPMSTADLYKFFPDLPVRFASPTHVSGALIQAMVKAKSGVTLKDAVVSGYVEFLREQVWKKGMGDHVTCLKEEQMRKVAKMRYEEVIDGKPHPIKQLLKMDADDAAPQQVDGTEPFDLKKFLDKPKGDEDSK